MTYTLWHGDCLEEMGRIEAGSVDAIICDLPYGTTACAFDVRIPFEPLWKNYKRVIKKQGAIVLFGSEPFSSLLRLSNSDWYRYDWVWEKSVATGFLDAKRRPLKAHENIIVFCKGQSTYNPQKETGHKPVNQPGRHDRPTSIYGKHWHGKTGGSTERYPRTVQRFNTHNSAFGQLHPTQKPVALLSYLILTYTNEGDTVLDSTCGSGSTLEAAMINNRYSIGIEKDAHYFSVAQQRLARVATELRGELNHLPLFAEAA